ncbi:liver carboxylesterase 1-like [Gracilinanus agilis]|uniref:liver carboxylesterase 1-like n=1 Tax=Gracilinanus agilis TaxID=191870 RepID=UPI001CFF4F26|nr:liver carboxylesterase 1-like [Gracilinanus agilis]
MMWLHTLILYIIAFTVQGQQPSMPIVDTEYGKVQGTQAILQGFDIPVHVFLGVPFAKPPLGPLRFTPPQPPEPWNYVKNTTTYPPGCSQNPGVSSRLSRLFSIRNETISFTHSEDCLYLNIYTPANLTKKTKLPVMVWVHGGGLFMGGASTYDGLALSAFENVVVVTIQYRLGILGFFSTGDEHAWGNWGCLDQVAGLQWIQKNIANFGGDPGSVTIFGEASGGFSVSSLILLKPLTLKFVFIPSVVDGAFFPKSPKELLAEKQFNDIPYIMGITNDEFGWFLPNEMGYPLSGDGLDQETATALLWSSYPIVEIPQNLTAVITQEYLGVTDDPVKKKRFFLDMLGDLTFGIPTVILAQYYRDAGSRTYLYEFQHPASIWGNLKPAMVRADHGDDLFFVFGSPFLRDDFSEEEKHLSRMMMKYWGNFARNG